MDNNNNGYAMPRPNGNNNYNQMPPQNMNNGRPPQNMNMNNGMNMNGRPPQNMNNGMNMNGRPPQNMNNNLAPQNGPMQLPSSPRPVSPMPVSPRPRHAGSMEYMNPNQQNNQNRTASMYSNNSLNDVSMPLLTPNMSGSNPNISMNQSYGGQSPMMPRSTSPVPNPNNPNSRIKKVQLYKGNYIVNCPVPDGVLRKGVFGRDIEEFGYLRYLHI